MPTNHINLIDLGLIDSYGEVLYEILHLPVSTSLTKILSDGNTQTWDEVALNDFFRYTCISDKVEV